MQRVASRAESKPAWPDHAASEPVHAASSDLFRHIAALTFCAAGRHSRSGAVHLPQESFAGPPAAVPRAFSSGQSPGLLLYPCGHHLLVTCLP